MTQPRYCLQQEEGYWLIVNARDTALAWSGSCWVNREQAARVLRFADEDAGATTPAESSEKAPRMVQDRLRTRR